MRRVMKDLSSWKPMAPTTERYETMKLEEAVREAALCLNGVLQEAGVFI